MTFAAIRQLSSHSSEWGDFPWWFCRHPILHSVFYIEGTTHYGRFDAENQPIQRPVKSVIVVRSRVP